MRRISLRYESTAGSDPTGVTTWRLGRSRVEGKTYLPILLAPLAQTKSLTLVQRHAN
jgi:hypothetical protein